MVATNCSLQSDGASCQFCEHISLLPSDTALIFVTSSASRFARSDGRCFSQA